MLIACVVHPGGAAPGADRLFEDGGKVSIALEAQTQRVVTADFNRDGHSDIACLHAGLSTVSVHLRRPGSPLGGAEPFDVESYAVGFGPVSFAVGDLDGDQDLDLAVASSGSSSISLLLNDGAGRFAAVTELAAGQDPRDIALEDFDSDGNLDIATTQQRSEDLRFFYGDGAGGYVAALPVRVGDNAHSLATADFDGDGARDVAVAHSGGVFLFRNAPGRSFDPGVDTRTMSPLDNQDDPRIVAAADFDRDGRAELAALTDQGALLYLDVGQGPGFEVSVIDSAADNVMSLAANVWSFVLATDFDADGNADLVVQQERSTVYGFRVYRGSGDGAFQLSQEFFFDSAPLLALSLSDIDGDGLLDVLAARSGAIPGELWLIRGTAVAGLDLSAFIHLPERPRAVVAFAGRPGAVQFAVLSTRAVHLLGADGQGMLLEPQSFELDAVALQTMVAADLDGNGDDELALSDAAAGRVLLVDQRQDGTLFAMAARPVREAPDLITAADVDGDGWTDLLLSHIASADLSLLLRPGAGNPPDPVDVHVGEIVTAFAAGDLDGDSRIDIATGTRGGLHLLFGDGGGSFPRSTAILDVASPLQLDIADVERDGIDDLIAVAGRELIVLHDAARGDASRRDTVAIGSGPHAFELEDIDGDGFLDIAITETRDLSAVRVFTKLVEGFGPPETYPLGSGLRGLALADLDRDGALDLAVADFVGHAVALLRGAARSAPVFRRGDVDLDGQVGIPDAVQILERLFAGGKVLPCADAADTDDDGVVALTDAVSLLVYLFRGGAAPAAPGPDTCGEDPTMTDALGCGAGCR